jgi:hypothetical protein
VVKQQTGSGSCDFLKKGSTNLNKQTSKRWKCCHPLGELLFKIFGMKFLWQSNSSQAKLKEKQTEILA